MTRLISIALGWLLTAYAAVHAVRQPRRVVVHTRVHLNGREVARAVQRCCR